MYICTGPRTVHIILFLFMPELAVWSAYAIAWRRQSMCCTVNDQLRLQMTAPMTRGKLRRCHERLIATTICTS